VSELLPKLMSMALPAGSGVMKLVPERRADSSVAGSHEPSLCTPAPPSVVPVTKSSAVPVSRMASADW
jgi:hypothetical protein